MLYLLLDECLRVFLLGHVGGAQDCATGLCVSMRVSVYLSCLDPQPFLHQSLEGEGIRRTPHEVEALCPPVPTQALPSLLALPP